MSRDGDYDWNNAHALLAARIAELESERDQAERERFRFGALNKGLSNRIAELEAAGIRASNEFSIALRDSRVRIAELEAEQTTPPMWRKAYDEQKIEIARLTAENARIAELESALRPFTKLRKVEQFKTAVLVEDDLITVVVRVGDIKAALAALSGEEKPRSRSTIS